MCAEHDWCVYLRQDISEVFQLQVISRTFAHGGQIQVCETVERESLQHQLKASGAQCIVGQTH